MASYKTPRKTLHPLPPQNENERTPRMTQYVTRPYLDRGIPPTCPCVHSRALSKTVAHAKQLKVETDEQPIGTHMIHLVDSRDDAYFS